MECFSPQEFTYDKAIALFRNRLRSYVTAAGGHSKHCLNTEWAADIHQMNVWIVDKKLCKVWSFICELWLSPVCYCMFTWRKLTSKFILLYPLNLINCISKICTMCCVNTHVQSLKVWLISVLPLLKYRFFPMGLFFTGAPCIIVYLLYRCTRLAMHAGRPIYARTSPLIHALFVGLLLKSGLHIAAVTHDED